MNREIKFRVWDNIDYMSSPFTLQDLQARNIQFTAKCVVMQFTGLKDKNGKDIYEGDILKNFGFINNACQFHEGAFGYWGSMKNDFISYESNSYNLKIADGKVMESEIIGNIHENPELINA